MKASLVIFTAVVSATACLPSQRSQMIQKHATGTFAVKTIPQPGDPANDGGFGRLLIDKSFQGSLEGGSKGTMLGFQAPDKTGAGYVALELVTGTLDGRKGSFVL